MTETPNTDGAFPLPATPEPPNSRRRRRLFLLVGLISVVVVVLAAVLIIVLVTGGGSGSAVQMRGTIDVVGNGGPISTAGRSCLPYYNTNTANSDIEVGTQVEVESNSGQTIGQGRIDSSVSVRSPIGAPTNDCVYGFAVRNLASSPFYRIQIAGHGTTTISKSQAAHVSLTIGG